MTQPKTHPLPPSGTRINLSSHSSEALGKAQKKAARNRQDAAGAVSEGSRSSATAKTAPRARIRARAFAIAGLIAPEPARRRRPREVLIELAKELRRQGIAPTKRLVFPMMRAGYRFKDGEACRWLAEVRHAHVGPCRLAPRKREELVDRLFRAAFRAIERAERVSSVRRAAELVRGAIAFDDRVAYAALRGFTTGWVSRFDYRRGLRQYSDRQERLGEL